MTPSPIHDPIHAADLALNELVDLCANLAVLLGGEIVPLPRVVLLRTTAILAAMDSALYTLIHWVEAAGEN